MDIDMGMLGMETQKKRTKRYSRRQRLVFKGHDAALIFRHRVPGESSALKGRKGNGGNDWHSLVRSSKLFAPWRVCRGMFACSLIRAGKQLVTARAACHHSLFWEDDDRRSHWHQQEPRSKHLQPSPRLNQRFMSRSFPLGLETSS
jgi:hypothetical protein